MSWRHQTLPPDVRYVIWSPTVPTIWRNISGAYILHYDISKWIPLPLFIIENWFLEHMELSFIFLVHEGERRPLSLFMLEQKRLKSGDYCQSFMKLYLKMLGAYLHSTCTCVKIPLLLQAFLVGILRSIIRIIILLIKLKELATYSWRIDPNLN